jgi:hypothetical protein
MNLPLACCLLLLLPGCTTIYEGGKPVLWTMADAQNVSLETPAGIKFHADFLNHSKPIEAATTGTGKILATGAGAGVLIP